RRVAGGLAALGLQRGDRLVAAMANRYELATLYWACQMLGAVITPCNWRLTEDELAYVLSDAGATLAAFDEGAHAAAEAAWATVGLDRNRLISVCGGAGTSFASLLDSPPVGGPA